MTLNSHYFGDMRERKLAGLRKIRTPEKASTMTDGEREHLMNEAMAALIKLGVKVPSAETMLGQIARSDEYEAELIVMAEVFSYWRSTSQTRSRR